MRHLWCAAMLGAALGGVAMALPVSASHGDHVVIAEVQIGGASTKDEFVELYNPTAVAVPLEGWRLSRRTASGSESNLVTTFPVVSIPAHGSLLIAHPDGAFAASADMQYATSESLAADNALVLFGAVTSGTHRPVIDLLGWGAANSHEGTAAPNPSTGQSLERLPGGSEGNVQDQGDNIADFRVQTPPTPQGMSAAPRPPLGEETQGSRGGEIIAPPPEPPRIRINEFVPDPMDGEEWVELVNVGLSPTDVTGWTIEDGAGVHTVLVGSVGIGAQRFLVVRNVKGVLNNGGDRIVLRDARAVLMDAVTYGTWGDAATTREHAPNASDGAAVARRGDGVDTDVDAVDFVRTPTPTPGMPNIVPAAVPAMEHAEAAAPSETPVSIVLNELLPDPVGDDRAEIIELRNLGSAAREVTGWRLRDRQGAEYVIRAADGPVMVPAHGVLTLARTRTNLVLENSGDTIRLYRPESDRAVSTAEYKDAPLGAAWMRADDGTWGWTTIPTPDALNVWSPPNRPPIITLAAPTTAAVGAIVTFDASDTADLDGDAVRYAWDFGDLRTLTDVSAAPVAVYVYPASGVYTATLTVTDTRGGMAVQRHRMTIGDADAVTVTPVAPIALGDARALRIVSLLPNPIGSEQGEWLDLANTSDAPIALRNWTLMVAANAAASARAGVRLPDRTIPGNQTLRLTHTDLRSWLRNDGAIVMLRAPDGAVIDTVHYPTAAEGAWYARTSRGWEWVRDGDGGDDSAPVETVSVAARRASAREAPHVVDDLDALRAIAPGTIVTASGVVSAPLGSINAQMLAIADASGGIMVYVGQRAIPTVVLGDRITVTGELRVTTGDWRIGIRAPGDIHVVGRADPIAPIPLRAQEAREDRLGALVMIAGSVVESRGRAITLDDGTDELVVVVPEAASALAEGVVAGDTLRAVGILQRTTRGFRVLARAASDIEHTKAPVRSGAASTAPIPVRPSRELGLLGGGVLTIVAISSWHRRRVLGLALRGMQRAIAQAIRR